MAYDDLSELKMTISTPYGPYRGADFYKNDTLSRSRNPENDTLFSGTSPYRKIYKCPPPGGISSHMFSKFLFNWAARRNFVFDQSLHLLTFEGLDQSEYTMTSRRWRKLWEAVGKTSPPPEYRFSDSGYPTLDEFY